MTNLPVQLQSVPFYGDMIEAIRTADNNIMVSLKRVCESLGVNPDNQRVKLQSPDYGWASTVIITVQVAGQARDLIMIDAESLPMWLVTIHPSKVKTAVREKLRTYQLEAKAVLAAWFQGNSPSRPDITAVVEEMKDRLAKLETAHASSKQVAAYYRERNDRLMKPLEPGDDGHYMGLREFCTTNDVRTIAGKPMTASALKSASHALSHLSRLTNIEIKEKRTSGSSATLCYRLDVLRTWRNITKLGVTIPYYIYERLTKRQLLPM
jgi:hypothetical protein